MPAPARTITVPQLVVLDFDRMLADNATSDGRLYSLADEFGFDVIALDKVRREVEDDGGSFAPFNAIRELIDDATMDALVERFITVDGYELMYPDSWPFLQRLDAAGVPHMVLTYGESQLWQSSKVWASGYKGAFQVLPHSNKGKHIASWRRGDGTYVFDDPAAGIRYEAQSICLLDDKASAFTHLPADCTGYWVKRTEILLPKQQGDVPADRVASVWGLGDLVVENGRLKHAKADV